MSSQEHPEDLNISMLPPDIRDRIYYDYVSLYMNNKMKVVHEELISNHPYKFKKFDWRWLSQGPDILEVLRSTEGVKIDWIKLSQGPNILDILRSTQGVKMEWW